GVNAFGFGGINAHVVLSAWDQKAPSSPAIHAVQESFDPPLLLARTSAEALIAALKSKDTETGQGQYRIAVFNPSTERLEKAIRIVRRDKPWHNNQDIWFTNRPKL